MTTEAINFDALWKFATRHGDIVQERSELEHVYNLMKRADCKSYLEVGTAEGNSLYVLSHALSESGLADYIDFCEEHTSASRAEVISELIRRGSPSFNRYEGDSTKPETHPRDRKYDAVLIDGGHDFATVLSDAILYAPLATKYVFFHDIQLPQVRAAVEWFVPRWQLGKYSTFINSKNYGYGIVEVVK